jgi:hypothetical protein
MIKEQSMTGYTTSELVEKLYSNLRILAPQGAESAYIAGYLYGALQDIATRGMDELIEHVDWTNQRVDSLSTSRSKK